MANTAHGPNGAELPTQAELRALSDSIILERLQFMRQAGISFGGARDLYEVLGYDRVITTKQYRDEYARGGIAKRIVEAFPRATWRGGVELYEDEDPDVSTEFETAWKKHLVQRLNVWSILLRADILAGLSTYSVILIGVADGDLSQELPKGNPDKLLFLTPFFGGGSPARNHRMQQTADDADASIAEYDTDTKSPRFGEPLTYRLRRTEVSSYDLQRPVHWSRIIHVAEGCLDDNVFGQPTLENVWNLLTDLQKVTGGGAEAFWLRANQGLHLDLDKDMALPDAKDTLDKLKEQAELYKHQMTRWLRTRGVSVETLGSDVANFNQPAEAILTQIAGSKGIPMRILTGSERGELASSQDAANFDSQVWERQTGYAGPMIVRRLVDRLIKYNYLPTPAQYEVGWATVEKMTEKEKAEGAKSWATTNQAAGEVVYTVSEIREHWHDMEPLTEDQLKEIADAAAEKVEQAKAMMVATTPEPDEKFPRAAQVAEEEELVKVLAAAIQCGATEVVDEIVGVQRNAEFNPEQPRDEQGQWTDGGAVGIVVKEYNTTGYGPNDKKGSDLAREGVKEAHKQLVKAGFVKATATEFKHRPGEKMGRSTAYTGSSKTSETHYSHPDGRTATLKADYQKYRESRVVVRHTKAPGA